MIPKTFQLLGRTITVKEVEQVDVDNDLGLWIAHQDEIRIRKDQSKGAKEHTFFHELAHAIFELGGHEKLSKDEALVDLVGGLIHQYMKTQKAK